MPGQTAILRRENDNATPPVIPRVTGSILICYNATPV
jgi:hypothetical protein